MKLLTGLAGLTLFASLVSAAEPIPFDSPRWQIEAEEHRIEQYKGKTSLVLRGGLALVADAEFQDGVIEYFCAFPEARAFVGVTWRVQDSQNREEFYIRPHQSGNPDANQYTPVFNGLSAWQLYYGEGYGTPITYTFDTWIAVKIVVSGDQAEVYIGDLETPSLFIDDLKRETTSGAVGLAVPNYGAVRYADFRFEKADSPILKGKVERARTAPSGAVMKWQVSHPFAEKTIEGLIEISSSHKDDLAWTPLKSESTGLVNLSRVSALSRETNTVFAKVTVVSDRAQSKILDFGYSDRLRLFFNDRLLYSGNNGYRTRDYRYLGTIGSFDAVTLPLQKGPNDLWFAVSESFGGWGVQAAFEDLEGITIAD
ncbi:MAG: hypothetical protein MUP13_09580 [Thermoanaerobaculales bacterium]|nr:hypothetical protein [Thermoanaerobaculales bacterium]